MGFPLTAGQMDFRAVKVMWVDLDSLIFILHLLDQDLFKLGVMISKDRIRIR